MPLLVVQAIREDLLLEVEKMIVVLGRTGLVVLVVMAVQW